MALVTGNVVLTAWYSYLNYTITNRQDDVLVSYTAGMIVKSGEKTNRKFTSTISATGMASQSGTLAAKSRSAGTYPIKTGSFTIPKGLNDSNRTITHSCVGTSSNSYTSTCKITFTVKRNKIVVKYDLNGGQVRNTEDDYSEKNYFVYEDIPIVSYIPQNPGYKFIGWSENNILVESETVSPRTTDLILTATWEKIDLGEINYRSYRYTDWDYDNETTPAESAGQNGFSFVQIEKIGNGELSNSIKNITITIEQNNVLLNTEFDEVDLWYSTMKNIDLTKSYDFSKKIYIESEYWDGEYLYAELNDKISEEVYVWDAYKQGSQMSMGIGMKAPEEGNGSNSQLGIENNGELHIAMDTYFHGSALDLMHPIGEIYTTTNENFDPNIYWGGVWEQLTSDTYFKIVTSDAGKTGGTSSQHKIPLTSIPSHRHTIAGTDKSVDGGSSYMRPRSADASGVTQDQYKTTYAGGGQAYYPYYYGVYAWHRIA